MTSIPAWLANDGSYYIKFGEVESKNDGDACISCITHEAVAGVSGPVCIDVGADAGWWSLFCKEYNASSILHVFEPNPNRVDQLQAHASNTFSFYNKAVSNTNSTIRIDFSDSNSNSRNDCGDIVETTTLDFIFDTVPKVDIIKIDTEGHDIIIVQSLEKYFNRINTIIFEFTVYWCGKDKNECLQKALDTLELLHEHYPHMYILCRNKSLRVFQLYDIDNYMPLIMSLYNNHIQVDIACRREPITSIEVLDETDLLGDIELIF